MKNRPNIILIVIDCARADHFSCYGYQRQTTPRMDQIAQEGTLFKEAISPACWTVPAHASLFTGTFGSMHRAQDGHAILDHRCHTLAEVLGCNGYRTVGFTNVGWVREATGLTRGFETFEEIWRLRKEKRPRGYAHRFLARAWWAIAKARWLQANITNRRVKTWLKRNHDHNEPFFLFIHYIDCHYPYEPPRPYDTLFLEDDRDVAEARQVPHDPYAYLAGELCMSPRDLGMLSALYDGELAYLDSKIGELVDHLKAKDILDDSLLILTSDHGENLGDHHLLNHKWCLYDSLIHIPLIVRYPKTFAPRTVVSRIVQTTDVFPTIMDLLEIEQPEVIDQLQGRSLLPEALERRTESFAIAELASRSYKAEFARRGIAFDTSAIERELRAIRTDRYKYIWASDGRDELYDIASDPGETNNLISTHPEVGSELRSKLLEWVHTHSADEAVSKDAPEEEDRGLTKHLRALGYID